MKSLKFLLAPALLVFLITLTGCPGPGAPGQTPQDKAVQQLSQSWKCTAATLGGAPVTGYENFVLSVSGTAGQTTFSYTTTGRPAPPSPGVKNTPWDASGTFSFGADFATQLVRNDALAVNYVVTDANLSLSFTYNGTGFVGGRTSSVAGSWVFTFSKQ